MLRMKTFLLPVLLNEYAPPKLGFLSIAVLGALGAVAVLAVAIWLMKKMR